MQLTAANAAKEQLRDRLLTDYKAALGVAMLDAFEAKAPLTRKRMMKDHELVAATSSRPAKYDGCAIFMAYKNATNPNDATRQDADAEALHAELSLALPANNEVVYARPPNGVPHSARRRLAHCVAHARAVVRSRRRGSDLVPHDPQAVDGGAELQPV